MKKQLTELSSNPREASPKAERVKQVFDTVVDRYDLMNDLMSLGSHRILKRVLVESCGIRSDSTVVDIAAGTGDIARLIAARVGSEGRVVMFDINETMLQLGRDKTIDSGYPHVTCVVGDAEALPFGDNTVDVITMGFGLRNMSDKETALRECHRVLKTGGRLVVLEFSTPSSRRLTKAFSVYRRLWPFLGQFVVGEASPYSYLVESIDRHPTQQALVMMFEAAGFRQVKYDNLLGGVVAMHQGIR